MSLEGKVALITGGGSGIGAATARRFVKEGAKVCIADSRQDVMKETADSLPAGSAVCYLGDVSNSQDVERMVQTALNFGGHLNVLINSAGYDPFEARGEINLEQWNRILDVNLTGPYLTMKTAIPHIIKAGGGSVINISSLAGIRFLPGKTAYSSSKAGLIGLTQQAAVEYGPSNVRCNVICPGAIRTPMLENNTRPLADRLGKNLDWVLAKFTAFSPLRRVGRPEEIAGICYFLASEDSSLITGGVLMADGGASVVDVNGSAMGSILANPPE